MSGRRNFLDTDNRIMEANLRFVKNDLEDNLNQYFGGSTNRNSNYSAPPRDYQVVQPRPDGSHAHDLERRKEFLLQLGLPRHDCYELAKSSRFDVKHFQILYQEYLTRGYRKDEIMRRILLGIRNEDNCVEEMRRDERIPLRRASPVSAVHNERENSNFVDREYYRDRSRSRSRSQPHDRYYRPDEPTKSDTENEYFLQRERSDQRRREEMFRELPYSSREEDVHKLRSRFLDRDFSPIRDHRDEVHFSQQKRLRRSRSYSPEKLDNREYFFSRGRSPGNRISEVDANRHFSPPRNQNFFPSRSRSRSPIRRINEEYRPRNRSPTAMDRINPRFRPSRSRSPNINMNEDRRRFSPTINAPIEEHLEINNDVKRFGGEEKYFRAPSSMLDNKETYRRTSREKSPLGSYPQHDLELRYRDSFPPRNNPVSHVRNIPSLLSLNVLIEKDQHDKRNALIEEICSRNSFSSDSFNQKQNYPQSSRESQHDKLSHANNERLLIRNNSPSHARQGSLSPTNYEKYGSREQLLRGDNSPSRDRYARLEPINYEQRGSRQQLLGNNNFTPSRQQLLPRNNPPAHGGNIPSLLDDNIFSNMKNNAEVGSQNPTTSTRVFDDRTQNYFQLSRENRTKELYAEHDKPSQRSNEQYGSREQISSKNNPPIPDRYALSNPNNYEQLGSRQQLFSKNDPHDRYASSNFINYKQPGPREQLSSGINSTARDVPSLFDLNICPQKEMNFESSALNKISSFVLGNRTQDDPQSLRQKKLDDLKQFHSQNFPSPRKLQTPVNNYNQSLHFFPQQKSMGFFQPTPSANVIEEQSISKKPVLYSQMSYEERNNANNRNKQTNFMNKTNFQMKKTSADNNDANLKKNIADVPIIQSGLVKPLPGFLKADPRDYWSKWWPRYKYIEFSVPKINPIDPDVKSCLHYLLTPNTALARSHKLMLIEKSITTIMKTNDVDETNYYTQDIFKLFQYKQHLEDPNFQNSLTPAELNCIAPALRQFQIRTVMAFMHQALIVKWHSSVEIMKKVLAGEPIKSNYARHLLNNKSFHYLVMMSIQELKKMCQQDWPGFTEFYKTIKAKKVDIYSLGVNPQHNMKKLF